MKKFCNLNPEEDNSTVKELKQKLHKSFIELSNMEELCREELYAQKIYYEAIVQRLQNEKSSLITKLKELQLHNSEKTDSILFDFDQSIIMNKKTSNFIQDQSFIDLMKGNKRYDICQYLVGLENQIHKELKEIPQTLAQYFENCQIVSRQSTNIYEDLQKCRESMQRMEIQHSAQIRILKELNQIQIRKLKEENKKLKVQNQKIYINYEKLKAAYEATLTKIQGASREEKILKLSNSSSTKNIKYPKEQENLDIYFSQRVINTDNSDNIMRFLPKIIKANRVSDF